jgi:hypothetical protein
MSDRVILCGNNCGHDHDSLNGPSGCCSEHGPYLYYCYDCHERWRAANPDKVEEISKLANPRGKKP